jgi:hypothetical protein
MTGGFGGPPVSGLPPGGLVHVGRRRHHPHGRGGTAVRHHGINPGVCQMGTSNLDDDAVRGMAPLLRRGQPSAVSFAVAGTSAAAASRRSSAATKGLLAVNRRAWVAENR